MRDLFAEAHDKGLTGDAAEDYVRAHTPRSEAMPALLIGAALGLAAIFIARCVREFWKLYQEGR